MAASSQLPAVVLFDIGNVLISLRPIRDVFPHDAFVSSEDSLSDDVEVRLGEFLRSQIFDRYERGLATTSEFFQALHAEFPSRLSPDELESCYRRILGEETPGMHELVLEIKQAGSRVAGLTDTSPVHLEEMDRYPVVRELEVVVASCETGHRKPAPGAFEAALLRLGTNASEVFYTDDREPNVEAARSLGIRAARFVGLTELREALSSSLALPRRDGGPFFP